MARIKRRQKARVSEAALAAFESTIKKPSLGAFSDFPGAYAWHQLFGQSAPPPPPSSGGSGGDEENESENEDESESESESESEAGQSSPGSSEPRKEEEGSEDGEDQPDAQELEDLGPGEDEAKDFQEEGESEPEPEAESLADLLARLRAESADREPLREKPELLGWDRWGYSVLRTEDSIHRSFDSWSDFCACVNDPSLQGWKTDHPHSLLTPESPHWRGGVNDPNRELREARGRKPKPNDWAGTWDFPEAIQMATTTGWPEGLRLMKDAMVAVAPKPEVHTSISFDLAGAIPCVPLYCTGDPACMMDFEDQLRQANPIIRIDLDISAGVSTSAKEMMLRGAAVLSFADQLEAQGYSTEIRLVVTINPSDIYTPRPISFSYAVAFKSAGEYWDLDRAAFAIAHPATFRRLGFRLLEQHGELESTYASYGRITHRPALDTNPTNTIFVPGAMPDETAESARQAVERAAAKFMEEGFE